MKILAFIATALCTILANVFGYAIPILAVVNFAWLLFKDYTLFSWWVLLWLAGGFLLSVVGVFIFGFLFVVKD